MILTPLHQKEQKMELFSKYQVALTDDCVAHGGRQEYPDGWVGQEAIPVRMEEGVLQSASAEVAKAAETLAKAQKARRGIKDARLTLERAEERRGSAVREVVTEYEACGPRAAERLRYIRFPRPFTGRDRDGRRPEKKTDSQNGMWIPEWQLHVIVEAEVTPPAAA